MMWSRPSSGYNSVGHPQATLGGVETNSPFEAPEADAGGRQSPGDGPGLVSLQLKERKPPGMFADRPTLSVKVLGGDATTVARTQLCSETVSCCFKLKRQSTQRRYGVKIRPCNSHSRCL